MGTEALSTANGGKRDDTALVGSPAAQKPEPAGPTVAAATSAEIKSLAQDGRQQSKADVSSKSAPSTAPAAAKGGQDASGPIAAGDSGVDDRVNPIDFSGDVRTDDSLPKADLLRKIGSCTVVDRNGVEHSFKSLYAGPQATRRVLVIFVRHFFCGNCQEYLRLLSASVTPDALLQLPASTSVVVIGNGDYRLIDSYAEITGCPFPLYTDRDRKLYTGLGMVRTLALGPRPAYMANRGMWASSWASIRQGLGELGRGLIFKFGDSKQVGGEFLFEPAGDGKEGVEKSVSWCHRMRNTRDHAEIPQLISVLGLSGRAEQPPAGEGDGKVAAASLAAQTDSETAGEAGTSSVS